jgi:hypothetical protein
MTLVWHGWSIEPHAHSPLAAERTVEKDAHVLANPPGLRGGAPHPGTGHFKLIENSEIPRRIDSCN